MKFKGNPGQLCRITKIRPNLVRKIPKSIRFDKDGVFETENRYLIARLKTKFEVVEEVIEETIIEEVDNGLHETEEKEEDFEEVEEIPELKDLGYKELQVLYVDKTGESAVGKKKVDILKELEG